MGGIGWFLGALVVTFFLSRVLLQVFKDVGGVTRFAVVHGISLVICIITAVLTVNEGAFPDITMLTSFLLPQGIWFVFDVARRHLRLRKSRRPSA